MNADNKKLQFFSVLGAEYQLPLMEGGSKTKEHILMEATILFAQKGFAAVSMRDLAEVIGLKPASLYNHFESKEALWDAVLDHSVELYLLYFNQMNEALESARNFEEVLELMFVEPKALRNLFTCYAFGLIHTEQFRDQRAGQIFSGTFLEYSIKFIQDWFDRCVAAKWVPAFDTGAVATMFMHSVLMGLNVKVQQTLGRPTPYEPYEMFENLQRLIMRLASGQAANS